MKEKGGLNPVENKDIEILILGTYPGIESLKAKEYYKKRTNKFWSITGKILGKESLKEKNKPYKEKISILLNHKIGLWDIFKECYRKNNLKEETASDRDIKSGDLNDFDNFFEEHKKICLVIFNGAYAYFYGLLYNIINLKNINIKYIALPSTSGSSSFKERFELWEKTIKEYHLQIMR